MRFLLHSRGVSQHVASQLKGSQSCASLVAQQTKNQKNETTVRSKEESRRTTMMKAWGQQCSPNCGCVVRFETEIDPATDKITMANYYAKTIVTTSNQQQQDQESKFLQPVLTSRTNRPLVQECSCPTLHQLASSVVDHLPSKKMSTVRNMSEFSSVRSSMAFRQTVLVEHELSKSDTHCFDVLEEAFTAMVKGHIPQPRPQPLSKAQRNLYVQTKVQQKQRSAFSNSHRSSTTGYGSDRSPISAVPQHAVMSALYMMDVDPDVTSTSSELSSMAFYGNNTNTYNNNTDVDAFSSSMSGGTDLSDDYYGDTDYNDHYYNRYHHETETKRKSSVLDWVTYVDELNAIEEEKSA
jgi:hypothetical protein